MINKRLSPKERGLLKGAIRRVFSRSELRREAIASARVTHFDPERPRVKKWCKCPLCGQFCAEYQMSVDHIDPVIPLDRSFEEMTLDETVDRMWCVKENLMPICAVCHNKKTKEERKVRRENKKRKRDRE